MEKKNYIVGKNMQKKFIMIEESLYEFAKRGRPKKRGRKPFKKSLGIAASDSWKTLEDEDEDEIIDDIDVSDMVNTDEIEVEEDIFDDKLFKTLSNEIKMIEPNRRVVKFRLKGNLNKILYGIPMTKIGENAFLFKLKNGSMKKIFLRDMIIESIESEKQQNRAKMVNETFWGHDDEDYGPFAHWLEDDDLPDEKECECDDIDESGKCRKCGKWYRSKEDDI